jgi:flagellar motor switch protein FliM
MGDNLKRTAANIGCQLGRGTIKARDFLKLEVGDLMLLDTNPMDESLIMVEGVPKFYGRVGGFRGNKATQITRAIPRRDLINIQNKRV